MVDAPTFYAGIDAGGTTFKIGIADAGGTLIDTRRIPTRTPAETLSEAAAVIREMAAARDGALAGLGIASFGPVDVDRASARYGVILDTPKPHWSGAALRESFARALDIPVVLDTDVNAALLAEIESGAARGFSRSAYITIGTGVGVGVMTDGAFAGRPFHPELGHIRVERHPDDHDFPGVCAIHGACLEGLLSAPALMARFGVLEEQMDNDRCWDIAGSYLAQLCLTLTLAMRLERIVVGGGVSNAPLLFKKTHAHYRRFLGAYLQPEERDPAGIIVRAGLGDDAGLLGAIALIRAEQVTS